jgi:hypothetical protein
MIQHRDKNSRCKYGRWSGLQGHNFTRINDNGGSGKHPSSTKEVISWQPDEFNTCSMRPFTMPLALTVTIKINYNYKMQNWFTSMHREIPNAKFQYSFLVMRMNKNYVNFTCQHHGTSTTTTTTCLHCHKQINTTINETAAVLSRFSCTNTGQSSILPELYFWYELYSEPA